MTGRNPITLRAAPELTKILRTLRTFSAPERAYAAINLLAELDGMAGAIRHLRNEAVSELHDLGLNWPEIADLVDQQPGTVRNWIRSADAARPEAVAAH